MTEQTENGTIAPVEIMEILKMLPHRYPFLLVDRVEDIILDTSAVGIKNVTMNEPQFTGHFPENPIMPGVMIVEAMAQTACVLVLKTLGEEDSGKSVLFMSIDKTRFRSPVRPGDVMRMKVTKLQNRRAVWKFSGVVEVNGKKVAEAEFSAMITD
ncbi:3-hydroxyacyl-ACP dehydratase FabZ [Sneathiella chinensis]|uniref:3-hydroxyacyl-[acyl-carrier-protein] dehydratase FabZ n=1 Tax=Sneathiella chinensis TaxID=349750 RepID=A0ABQ5U506_9PROT|nr:3-hydroxyacyl-ACP dehydratase FabZ [Sneathiella chinensis]GLQ07207.1 3-hydroxyacyl-[acyl-carrier-protein] dehydratase FabZ [Sneathiella chinensis]